LFLILAVVFFAGLAVAFWSYWSDTHPARSEGRAGVSPTS
jgi:hypothetical protein